MKRHIILGFVFVLFISGFTSCGKVNPQIRSNRTVSKATLRNSAMVEGKRLVSSDFVGQIEFKKPTEDEASKYILQIGDQVDIKFFYNPELNERVTIRPDGRISLQLIDEVMTAGLTPSELDNLLTELYSTKLDKAEVAVIVKEFSSLIVYVGGEVNSPGIIPLSSKLTTFQAILYAGGFKDTAEPKSVVVLRDQGTQNPLFMVLNLKKNLTNDTAHNDILLKSHDIVFVPKSTIAKMNQFVDQYINELIPVTLSFGLVYNLNPQVEVK